MIEKLKEKYRFPEIRPDEEPDKKGWFRVENSAMLRMMLNKDVKVIMEIGSLFGLSTRNILDFAPEATIIAIDTWKGSKEFENHSYLVERKDRYYDIFISSCWDYKDRIIPIKSDSISGMKIAKENGVVPELIYMDASHEYSDVINDIKTAKELFPKAILCGDDCDKPEVNKAVNENGTAYRMDGFWWYS